MKPLSLLLALLCGCGGGEREPYSSCWSHYDNRDDQRRFCEAAVKCGTYIESDPECKAISK